MPISWRQGLAARRDGAGHGAGAARTARPAAWVHALHQVLVGADGVAPSARGVGARQRLDLQEGLDRAASAGSTGFR